MLGFLFLFKTTNENITQEECDILLIISFNHKTNSIIFCTPTSCKVLLGCLLVHSHVFISHLYRKVFEILSDLLKWVIPEGFMLNSLSKNNYCIYFLMRNANTTKNMLKMLVKCLQISHHTVLTSSDRDVFTFHKFCYS